MIRRGYLLIGRDAYRLATKYLNEWDLAITEPPHVVALTDRLPETGRRALLVEAVQAGLETVPIEVDLPDRYHWTRYGFAIDPTVIRVRADFLPTWSQYVVPDELPGPRVQEEGR
jgi:hypothetical protein